MSLHFPRPKRILDTVGENIKLARLRRNLSAGQVAERAGISRTTVHSIENGKETVSIGAYMSVMAVLNLEKDFLQLANDDLLGRKLQDINMITRKRSS